MSEQEFKDAKGELAFSQQHADKFRASSKEAEMMQEQPQEEEVTETSTESAPESSPEAPPVNETPEVEEKDETSLLTTFMDEVRALFSSKENEEKKTQELISKHEKDMGEIKQGLTELLNEDNKEN